ARGEHFESPGRQSALQTIAALPIAEDVLEYLLLPGFSPQAGELGLALYAALAGHSPRSSERVVDWLNLTAIPIPVRLAALKALLKTPRLGNSLIRRATEQFIAGIPDK